MGNSKRVEVAFEYSEFQNMIKEHNKDMRRQTKNNLGVPKEVIVYEKGNSKGFEYKY